MSIDHLLFVLELYKTDAEILTDILPIELKSCMYVIYKTRYEICVIDVITIKTLQRLANTAKMIYNEETKDWYEHTTHERGEQDSP